MLSLRSLMSFAAACLVLSCEPVDRDYGEYEVNETPVAYPTPAIVATGAPDVAPCLCMPTCSGLPLMSGGPLGCEPTLGRDAGRNVIVRMSHNQEFAVYQSGTASLAIRHRPLPLLPLSEFTGDVRARRFTQGQPVRRDTTFFVDDTMNVVAVDPNGDTVAGYLPFAADHPGRVITFKVMGPGALEIYGATNQNTGTSDPIDGLGSLWIEGTQSGALRAVTLQAFDHTNALPPGSSGWVAISSYP